MTGEFGSKLDEILKKLQKLDAIETTLNEVSGRLAKVEDVVEKMKDEARVMDTSVKELEKGVTSLNDDVADLHFQIKQKDRQIEDLYTKQLYLESYSRRENLKFFGIPEAESSGAEGGMTVDTKEILYDFSERFLCLENPKSNIEIQRVHRSQANTCSFSALPRSRESPSLGLKTSGHRLHGTTRFSTRNHEEKA